MTNEELLTDLKQFIETCVSRQLSQQMAHSATKEDIKVLTGRLDTLDERVTNIDAKLLKLDWKVDILDKKIDKRIHELDEKLDCIQNAIADMLVRNTNAVDAQLEDHRQRLQQLEHRAV